MADNPPDISELPQHPYVNRLRPNPTDPAPRVVMLVGLLADSDRPGFERLYLDEKLAFGVEFKIEDIVDVKDVARDQSPFVGETATRVTIRDGAQIEFVRACTTEDLFDIDCSPLDTPGPAALCPSPQWVVYALYSKLPGCK
jgi:hypothetical protein